MSAISRRAVAKGAAWTAPAVAVGAVVPVYAASGQVTVTALTACRTGSNFSDVSVNLSLVSTLSTDAVVTITSVTPGQGSLRGSPTITGGNCPSRCGATSTCVAAGSATTPTLGFQVSSPNVSSATISYSVYSADGCTLLRSGTLSVTIVPCGGQRSAETSTSSSSSSSTTGTSTSSSTSSPTPSTTTPATSGASDPSSAPAPAATPSTTGDQATGSTSPAQP